MISLHKNCNFFSAIEAILARRSFSIDSAIFLLSTTFDVLIRRGNFIYENPFYCSVNSFCFKKSHNISKKSSSCLRVVSILA